MVDEILLKKIKLFAEDNMSLPDALQVTVEEKEFSVSNPWIDRSGRFPLTDEQAVETWGLDVVLAFCNKVIALEKEGVITLPDIDDQILCGFVWCHGPKDFSVFEVNLAKEDRKAIEAILAKYETEGSSLRNCYEEKFSKVFSEFYEGAPGKEQLCGTDAEEIALDRLLSEDEELAEFYTTESLITNCGGAASLMIVRKDIPVEHQDLHACLEETLHRLLDNGADEGVIERETGMRKLGECEDIEMIAEEAPEDAFTHIDLGYVLPGQILSVWKKEEEQ